jgi:hypothetical protein
MRVFGWIDDEAREKPIHIVEQRGTALIVTAKLF